MLKSPWIPYLLGPCIITLGATLILFSPETLHMHLRVSGPSTFDDPDGELDPDSTSTKLGLHTAVKTQLSNGFKQLQYSLSVVNSWPILLLLITFLLQPFSRQSIDLSIRYISDRFSWTLRQAGYLLSLRALINILLFFIVLPFLSHVLTCHFHFSFHDKDLLLARISILILILGACIIALSPTVELTVAGLVVYTFGTGYVGLARALITECVDKEHVGRLYAAISIVETTGSLVAGPALAIMFTEGLEIGGVAQGMPFMALAGVCMVGGVGIWTYGWLRGREGRDVKDIEERVGFE